MVKRNFSQQLSCERNLHVLLIFGLISLRDSKDLLCWCVKRLMNGMGNCSEDSAECPLCMEPFEVDDLNFYPCTCGYQVSFTNFENVKNKSNV